MCVEELNDINKPGKEEEEEFVQKWKEIYKQGDRFLSPNISCKDTNISLKI